MIGRRTPRWVALAETLRRPHAPAIAPAECAHCRTGAGLAARVIGGVGLRLLCLPCERALSAMGLDVFEDRRRTRR